MAQNNNQRKETSNIPEQNEEEKISSLPDELLKKEKVSRQEIEKDIVEQGFAEEQLKPRAAHRSVIWLGVAIGVIALIIWVMYR